MYYMVTTDLVDLWFAYDSLANIFSQSFEYDGLDDEDEVEKEDEESLPKSVQLLDQVVDYMTIQEMDGENFAKNDLKQIFLLISQHYEEAEKEAGDDYDNQIIYQITMSELKTVFSHLAYRDGSMGSPFEMRSDDDFATIVDLIHILDKLVIQFSLESDDDEEDFDENKINLANEDEIALANIFESMAEHYMNKDLNQNSDADLFIVFDRLSEEFEFYSDEEEDSDATHLYLDILDDLVEDMEEWDTDDSFITKEELQDVFS